MGLYNTGLVTRTNMVPGILEPYTVRMAIAKQGAADWNRGASRFYGPGIGQSISVGAASTGPIGSLTDWLVRLLLDLLHIGLLVAGCAALFRALFP